MIMKVHFKFHPKHYLRSGGQAMGLSTGMKLVLLKWIISASVL